MTFVELKKSIETYGVKKQHTCPFCGFQWELNNTQRFHLAECMQENPHGIWAFLNCPNCGYINTLYPTALNSVKVTKAECEEITEKMKKICEGEQ